MQFSKKSLLKPFNYLNWQTVASVTPVAHRLASAVDRVNELKYVFWGMISKWGKYGAGGWRPKSVSLKSTFR